MTNETLVILSLKDFLLRSEDIYEQFWDDFAQNHDITEYRDYLLYSVSFSESQTMQETIAGIVWEYLMGDLIDSDLDDLWVR